VFRAQSFRGLDGAVLSNEAFVLRYFGGPAGRPGDDRILIVNLGRDLKLDAAPEPLLAPPAEQVWEVQWSSEAPGYGGSGTAPVDSGEGWRVPGHAAVVMSPAPQKGKWEI
jgi:maltooligosyltrehalose trehalohydrolase